MIFRNLVQGFPSVSQNKNMICKISFYYYFQIGSHIFLENMQMDLCLSETTGFGMKVWRKKLSEEGEIHVVLDIDKANQ